MEGMLANLTLDDPRFYSLLLATVLIVAAKHFASRLSDDLYAFLKQLFRRFIHFFMNSQPKKAIIKTPTSPHNEPTLINIAIPVVAPLVSATTPTTPQPKPAATDTPTTLTTTQGIYQDIQRIANGEIGIIYQAKSDKEPVIIKLATELNDNDWLQHEATTLRTLSANAQQYAKHLPVLIDQFRSQDNRLGNIFNLCEGYDLVALRQRFPQGVEPRHVLWIFRRVLSVLGYVHQQGILHGNIEPAHIIVRPHDHNVWLVDWCYAIVLPKETGAILALWEFPWYKKL